MEIKRISKGSMIALLLTSIIAGILFCVLKSALINILITVIGVLLMIVGLLSLFQKRIGSGVIKMVIGVALILCAWLWTEVVFIIFGAMMIVTGVYGLVYSIKFKDGKTALSSALSIAIGGLLISCKWAADFFIYIIGALFIVTGIVGIVLLCVPEKEKKVKTVDVKDSK